LNADRILIVSHGHPDLSPGGGEIAAYSQWQELRRQGIEAMFLARAAVPSGHPGTPFSARSADGREVLFHAPPVDHFRHSQTQRRVVYQDFRALLEEYRPTAVHFHHYVHLGLEFVRETRRYSSAIPILLTLHDYLGICNAHGQMKKTHGALCEHAGPLDCHLCFPERSAQDFFLRELFIKSFFNLVDRFICPSQFLRDRYVSWGLPAERMVVLDNGQPRWQQEHEMTEGAEDAQIPVSSAQSSVPAAHTRFVVLGQLSELKGTLVLLEAARALPNRLRPWVRIEIHGSLQQTDERFSEQLRAAQEELSPLLRYCGPYLHGNVDSIVRAADWVIVPSIWWENSPLVIQEAFRAGRPVICSDIGGMAEKVVHGVNGLHFLVGNAADLARRIEQASTTPGLWDELRRSIPEPPTIEEVVARQLALYRSPRGTPGGTVPTLRMVATGGG
jgi:glycosyltransferase involved in cell wall biosynthesis